jgi:hypothetical protein
VPASGGYFGVGGECGGDAYCVDRAPGEEPWAVEPQPVRGGLGAEPGDADEMSLVIESDEAGAVKAR